MVLALDGEAAGALERFLELAAGGFSSTAISAVDCSLRFLALEGADDEFAMPFVRLAGGRMLLRSLSAAADGGRGGSCVELLWAEDGALCVEAICPTPDKGPVAGAGL